MIIVITASIFFPWAPLFAYLGIAGTSGTALAISVVVEAAIAIIQLIFIDSFFQGFYLGSQKEQPEEQPESYTDDSGKTWNRDHERNEYCSTIEGAYWCVNESKQQPCIIEKDSPDLCVDGETVYFEADGVKHIYDQKTGLYNPPAKKEETFTTSDGLKLTLDHTRDEYTDTDKTYNCINET